MKNEIKELNYIPISPQFLKKEYIIGKYLSVKKIPIYHKIVYEEQKNVLVMELAVFEKVL